MASEKGWMVLVSVVLLASMCVCAAGLPNTREEAEKDLQLKMVNPVFAFEKWVEEHGASYLKGTEEWMTRFRIWVTNLHKVVEHNGQHDAHWLVMNKFADLTQEEFKSKFLGLKVPRDHKLRSTKFRHGSVDLSAIPVKKDWRDENAVSEVKDQGECGSCWSFSTTGSVEGINAIYGGDLVSLSEQELLDCDTTKDAGCDGGWMDYAFEWIIANGGLTTEQDYPYVGYQERCSGNKIEHRVVNIDGFEDVPVGQDPLLQALSEQPVSVAVQANSLGFQLYGGGVYSARCGTDLDHGVLAMGYSTEPGNSYFTVKNSWGPEWGEEGYIRLALDRNGENGQCGITMAASYPVKSSPNPPSPSPEPSPAPGPDPEPTPTPSPPGPSPSPPAPPPPPPRIVCNALTSCGMDETCCCSWEYYGFCFYYGCCPFVEATCCDDNQHCCPQDQPICDMEKMECTNGTSSSEIGVKHPARGPWSIPSFWRPQTEDSLELRSGRKEMPIS